MIRRFLLKGHRWPLAILIISLLFVGSLHAGDPVRQANAATTAYHRGNFQLAEVIIQRNLDPEVTMDDWDRAMFWYLNGLLTSRLPDQSTQTIRSFQTARSLWANDPAAAFSADLGLIDALINNDQLGEAEEMLTPILEETQAGQRGYPLYLASKLARLRGEFEDALHYSEESLDDYLPAGKEREIADATMNLGLYQMLTGEYGQGYENTVAAQEIIVAIGDQNKYFYSLINLIVYQRCYEKRSADRLIRLVEARIRRDHDKNLEDLLDMVCNLECP